MNEIRVSEIRGSEIRGSNIRVTEIRVREIRVREIRVSRIRVSEIRVSEIRISSNHRELHGAIFLHDMVNCPVLQLCVADVKRTKNSQKLQAHVRYNMICTESRGESTTNLLPHHAHHACHTKRFCFQTPANVTLEGFFPQESKSSFSMRQNVQSQQQKTFCIS